MDEIPQDLQIQALESEMRTLWSQISAATYQFLLGVQKMDECHGGTGFKSVADWLGCLCGIGTVAAREKVRVAKCLADLPQISLAFSRGEISYSKVRAITRVATTQNEHVFLQAAHYGTAQHVERLVRLARRYGAVEAAEQAQQLHRERYVRHHWDEDGSLRLNIKLGPEEGALFLKALSAGESQLMDDMEGVEDIRGGYQRSGFNQAKQRTRADQIDAQDLSGESDYEEWASPSDCRQADVLVMMANGVMNEGLKAASTADQFQVVVHVDAKTLHGEVSIGTEAKNDSAESSAPCSLAHEAHQHCELEDGNALAPATVRRISCDASRVTLLESSGQPLALGRKTRQISPALRRALKARDGECRFPGCHRHQFTDAHHVQHWADGGETNLDNLVTLCRFHHRLLHEGGFAMQMNDGIPIFTNPAGERIAESHPMGPSHPAQLVLANRARGIVFDQDRMDEYRWHGERCDYSVFIEHLLAAGGIAKPEARANPNEKTIQLNREEAPGNRHRVRSRT